MSQTFLIDTDTASDDAVALIMALRHPDVYVEAITVVAGNVPVAQAVQNALYTVEICGAAVPVYRGAAKPLMRRLETAQNVHGVDGMGDIGLALHGRAVAAGHAVLQLIERINRAAHEHRAVTLVTLGPLTNIALALSLDSGIAQHVSRCVIMGGTSDNQGNVSPLGEFNFWADPEAAKIVLESDLPITMVGWDISRKYATFDPQQSAELRAIGTPLAHFAVDIQASVNTFAQKETFLAGYDLPDPIAMAVAIDPQVLTESIQAHVSVEPGDGLCRGQAIIDHRDVWQRRKNTQVVLAASRERFLALLRAALV